MSNFASQADQLLKDAVATGKVLMRDPDVVRTKIQRILEGGAKRLNIVSDFDMTMTKYWVDGQRGPSTHRILTRSPRLGAQFQGKDVALYNKYYPIEVDPNVPREEKARAMEEWWIKAHELIATFGVTRDDIRLMVQDMPMHFRDGLKEIIQVTRETSVPFLVFSAGIYDVIREILEQSDMKPANVHVVSNRMKFDDNGVCVDWLPPLIHVFNKGQAEAHGEHYKRDLIGRNHMILMGDSVGDLEMSHGLEHDVLLTFGFLNHDEDSLMEHYLPVYDVVLTGDQSMNFVLKIVEVCCKPQ